MFSHSVDDNQESVLRSTEISMTSSELAFVVEGKSMSMVGGAKYICKDIIQIMIPKNSCKFTTERKALYDIVRL